MFTYHDPNGCFNADLSGGFQNTIIKGLIYSEPGKLRIFPAKPDSWDKGEISGIEARGGIHIHKLEWDGAHGKMAVVSCQKQKLNVTLPNGKLQEVSLPASKETTIER